MRIGIINLNMGARGGGEKRTLALAEHLSRSHQVWLLVNEQIDRPSLEQYFGVDLSRVRSVALDEEYRSVIKSKERPRWGRLNALAAQHSLSRRIKSLKFDVFINNSYASSMPCPSARGIYMCMFPHILPEPVRVNRSPRQVYYSLVAQAERRLLDIYAADFLDSYSVVTANSRFTAGWVNKLWGRLAEVIYSACDSMGPPAAKDKVILSVGRFKRVAPGTLYKRQHVLLEVFKRLTAIHRDGWQLHFVGSVAPDAESSSLVERLKESATGYPVRFHFDAELGALRDLYRRAPIYWHATGYGIPAHEQPALQEHFGMTTVEAMSAGAVPVAINAGGLREAVTHGVDGLLWDEPSDLADQTLRLINDSDLLRRLSRQAVSSSARFTRAAFNASMDAIIERLMCQS
jgi:glycosyltransferase involved in cell wall biosynthesis